MNQRGFTFIEILLSLGIFSILAAGSLSLFKMVSREGDRTLNMSGRNLENEQMLEHLSQPIYFGLLAGYSQNAALKSCITLDSALCDVAKDYPLTAINISTGLPMEYISGSLTDGIRNRISFQVHCPLNQTSCDQADYFVVKVQTEISRSDEAPFTIERSAMVSPEITNAVTFIPDSKMTPGRNINVILLLDNSNSLASVKSKIKNGLNSIISIFGDLNARVGIYSLNSGSNTFSNIERFTLDGTDRNYLPSNLWAEIPGGTTVYQETNKTYNYRSFFTSGSSLLYRALVDFLPEDSATLRTEKQAALGGITDDLFAASGVTYDTPLCSMLHLIDSTNSTLPIDEKTPTIFLLISNEDDETLFPPNVKGQLFNALDNNYSCYKQTVAKYTTRAFTYDYWGQQQSLNIKVTAQYLIDDAPANSERTVVLYINTYDPSLNVNDDCTSLAQTKQAEIHKFLKDNAFVGTTYLDSYTLNSCSIGGRGFILTKSYTDTELCSTQESIFIQQFPHYKPGSCTRSSSGGGMNFIAWESLTPMVDWSSTAYLNQDAPLAVANRLKEKGVDKNIFFVPIIHQASQASSCPLTVGASYGNKYEKLAGLLGTQGEVLSICAADYSTKLKSLTESFVSEIGRNDIEMPAAVAAAMKSVEVLRGTEILKPVRGTDYDLFNNSLIFTSGYLKATDTVKVYIQ